MSIMSGRKKIGFIGLGIMGRGMAGHILDGGHELHVYNRTRSKADELVARGAIWHDTAGDLAAVSDVVITIVGYPKDVEETYLGADGIVERAKSGTILIDMTTSSPTLAGTIAAKAMEKGVAVLDAPVSGGDVGARAAKLSIMVGGDEETFKAALPLFQLMGENIVHHGGPGAGQHVKMCNQIAIAATMLAVSESLAYAKASGLDAKRVLSSIGTGAASSFLLNNLGPKMLDDDYAPGFYVHHFIKDMSIAIAEAERMKLDLPALALAKRLYEKLAAGGFGEEGTQAIFRVYGN
ncbi:MULTISPECIES: NAD(P)-dependent oxidoreductase [Alphaproteobacteria]|uniref:Oxidoreductase YkwC n=2 Tax=Alphaproteobacteria TaxID=28211 RepID=A0ABQ6E6P4_9SPHN|nr:MULTISPECIES: NAD(P)-dependent oxidoreductase [Alphaproteobacteria]GEO84782.1 putative oxidoreductase YkwC [Ciceribacter naphthalenivorans]GLR20597.1 putative oxidoreductase YkwC [Ciceribacter naphthalenivorans]GLT03453.1 putative oxidoreductase YkwC [Sphingomonas psychrolutea]